MHTYIICADGDLYTLPMLLNPPQEKHLWIKTGEANSQGVTRRSLVAINRTSVPLAMASVLLA